MSQQNYFLAGNPLSLDRIRSILIRLEDTIIFSLIERAQFAHNPRMYQTGAFKELRELGFEGTWLEWFLREVETFHAKARRYTSPDEYPFTSNLPGPVLPPLQYPPTLYPNSINVNASILNFYTRAIVPRLTRRATLDLATIKRANGITGDAEFEDDGNHGSAATLDVETLQAISKRVHYGKFVSESKFIENPAAFIPHIQNPNRAALEALITKPEVERKVLLRLRKKAAIYAQDFAPDGEPLLNSNSGDNSNGSSPRNSVELPANGHASGKICVESVVDLYESYIIPLTKEVEVDYLLRRLDGLTKEEIDKLAAGKQ